MRLLQYLNEDYVTTGNSTLGLVKSEPFEIFVNPTSKDLSDLKKSNRYVRYVADFKKKNLWVWDVSYIHIEGLVALNDDPRMKEILDSESGGFKLISTGVAEIQGNRLKFIESDAAWTMVSKPWTLKDDTWLSKWFTEPYTKTYIDVYHKSKGIKEEWETSIKIAYPKIGEHLYDIYRNPTSSDYTDLKKKNGGRGGVRAIVDASKGTVYVFPDDILHYLVINKLNLKGKPLFAATGYIEGSKIKATSFGFYSEEFVSFHDKKIRKIMDMYFTNLKDWDSTFR